jgi:hypothetical protein
MGLNKILRTANDNMRITGTLDKDEVDEIIRFSRDLDDDASDITPPKDFKELCLDMIQLEAEDGDDDYGDVNSDGTEDGDEKYDGETEDEADGGGDDDDDDSYTNGLTFELAEDDDEDLEAFQ